VWKGCQKKREVIRIYKWKPFASRPIGRPKIAPVRKHLRTVGLFEGDPTCRFCRKEAETAQHIVCGCEALCGLRYSVFGYPFVDPKDISTASVRNLCLFIKGTGLLNCVLNVMFRVSTISLWLRCIRGKYVDGPYRRRRRRPKNRWEDYVRKDLQKMKIKNWNKSILNSALRNFRCLFRDPYRIQNPTVWTDC
jgi:hypothetical protein